MKKIIVAGCIAATLLCGCGVVSMEEYDAKAEEKGIVYAHNFILVERYGESSIYVDKNTRVMYWGDASGNATWMTVILNADGTPMLWEDDLW